jgi:ribonuclease T
MRNLKKITSLSARFRRFYPVVIDIETAGFNAQRDAMLELAAITLCYNEEGNLVPNETYHYHIEPYPGLNLDPESLAFTGIKPFNPFRFAMKEGDALKQLFQAVDKHVRDYQCQRAVLVGHNPNFDLSFLQAAAARHKITKTAFHHFTTFDTATLSALVFGQTVLAKAVKAAGISFDLNEAHSALYDAKKTAELFCHIVNLWNGPFHISDVADNDFDVLEPES